MKNSRRDKTLLTFFILYALVFGTYFFLPPFSKLLYIHYAVISLTLPLCIATYKIVYQNNLQKRLKVALVALNLALLVGAYQLYTLSEEKKYLICFQQFSEYCRFTR